MQTNQNTSHHTKPKTRFLKFIVVSFSIILLLLLLLFILLPVYVSSESGKNMFVNKINRSLDGTIALSDLTFSWFRGVKLKGVNYYDHQGTTTVNIKQASAKPSYLSLLRGSVRVDDALLEKPQVVLNVSEQDLVYAAAGAAGAGTGRLPSPSPAHKDKAGLALKELDLEVREGNVQINLTDQTKKTQTVQFQNITSKVDLNPAGKKSVFDIALNVAGAGRNSQITAKGDLTPSKKRNWTLKGGDFTIEIDQLELQSLRPLFALAGKDLSVSGQLNADIEVKVDNGDLQKLKARALIDDFSQMIGTQQTSLNEQVSVNADISHVNKQLKIDTLQVKSSFCSLTCSGGRDQVSYTASANLKQTFDFVEQFVPIGTTRLEGILNSSGKLYLSDDMIRTDGSGSIENMILVHENKNASIGTIQMLYNLTHHQKQELVKISSLQTESQTLGMVTLLNSTLPIGKSNKNKTDVNIETRLDLAKIAPIAKMFAPIPNDAVLGGTASGRVSLKQSDKGYHITGNNLQASDLVIGKTGETPFTEKLLTLNADMVINPKTKEIQIDDLRIDSSKIKVNKGTLQQKQDGSNTQLKGEFETEYDLQAVSSMGSAFLPEGLKMTGKRKDTIHLSSTYPTEQKNQMLANLNGTASFGFDSAEFMGLNFGKVETNVDIKDGLLTIAPFQTMVNEGTLRFAGKSNLKAKKKKLITPKPMHMIEKIKITDSMTDNLLMYVNPLFAEAVNVRGILDFKCHVLKIPIANATKNDLVVKGILSMNNVRLEGSSLLGAIMQFIKKSNVQNLTLLPTEFVLRRSVLSYENMQINVDDNPLNFSGKINLNKRMNMNITLPYTIDGRTVKTNEVSNPKRITLPLAGSLTKPKLRLDKLLEEQGKRLLEEEGRKLIEKGLEELFKQ